MELYLLHVFLAALGAFVAYMAMGFALFAAMPAMKTEFMKYPNVYREEKDLMKHMPLGMLFIFISILMLAVLYTHMQPWESGWLQGLCFGVLIGVFALGTFVIHNHVNLRIGWMLTTQQGIAYFTQWVTVGIILGIIYSSV